MLDTPEDFLKPEEPDPSDCCNSGCSPCVFDLYRKQLEEWKQRKYTKCSDKLRTDLLSQTRFKPFRLIKKIVLTDNFFVLRFQPATEETNYHIINSTPVNRIGQNYEGTDSMLDIPGMLPYSIGQHVVLRGYCCNKSLNNTEDDDAFDRSSRNFNINDQVTANEKPCSSLSDIVSENMITRSYTPITVASKVQNCYFDILVKIYEYGPMSNILKYLKIGETVDFRGPYGDYVYTENMYSHILMICMGTGIAPMYPIAKSIVENEIDETSVHLVYGVKNVSEILLRDELRKLTDFWNFTETVCLSQEKDVVYSKFGENFVYKKIDKELIEKEIFGMNLEKLFVLICGSDAFCANMLKCVVHCNVSERYIHVF